jgi:hypothetical protein
MRWHRLYITYCLFRVFSSVSLGFVVLAETARNVTIFWKDADKFVQVSEESIAPIFMTIAMLKSQDKTLVRNNQ